MGGRPNEYPSNHHVGEYVLVFPSILIKQFQVVSMVMQPCIPCTYMYIQQFALLIPASRKRIVLLHDYKFKPPRSLLIRLKFQQQCSSLWVPKTCFVCLGRWIFCGILDCGFTCSPRSRRRWSNVMSWNHQLVTSNCRLTPFTNESSETNIFRGPKTKKTQQHYLTPPVKQVF